MRHLVTGATGLVGSHVVDGLLERGETVRALVFEPEAAEALTRRGVEIHLGDLTGSDNLAAATDGAEAIIHCAGAVQVMATRQQLWDVNVKGTERLLAAAASVGLPRFVFISSTSVYGHPPSPVSEDAPKRPVGAYGESKWAAEEVLWRFHADYGLPGVALRPCPIYGPRDKRITQALVDLGRLRVAPLPNRGGRVVDLVYVTDVADAAIAATTAPAAVGHAYNITDGESHSYRDVLLAYEQITGRRPAIVPVPGAAVVGFARLLMWLRQKRGVPGDWTGQVARARGFVLDTHYSIEAARRDLGYQPKVGLVEGLRRTLQAPGASRVRPV
jgi:nucleoside-diphosphate-sugar epimerase